MEKKYIKPETKVIQIESHLMDNISKEQFGDGGGGTNGQDVIVDSKGFGFFEEEEEMSEE